MRCFFSRFHRWYKSAMTSTAEWLESIGLGEYAQRFADNAIDLSILRDLTDQDLKELGMLLGHRRKMLRAIAELDVTTSIASIPQQPNQNESPRTKLSDVTLPLCSATSS